MYTFNNIHVSGLTVTLKLTWLILLKINQLATLKKPRHRVNLFFIIQIYLCMYNQVHPVSERKSQSWFYFSLCFLRDVPNLDMTDIDPSHKHLPEAQQQPGAGADSVIHQNLKQLTSQAFLLHFNYPSRKFADFKEKN